MSEMKVLGIEEWEELFQPIVNTVEGGTNPNKDPSYQRFETYGPDLEFVYTVPPNLVWTVLDCDGDLIIANGFHYVNRFFYMVCSVPCAEGDEYHVEYYIQGEEDDEPEDDHIRSEASHGDGVSDNRV